MQHALCRAIQAGDAVGKAAVTVFIVVPIPQSVIHRDDKF